MAAYESMLGKNNLLRQNITAGDLVALETYMGRIYGDLVFEREGNLNVLTSSRLYRRLEKVFGDTLVITGAVFAPKVGKKVVKSITKVEKAARRHLQLSGESMKMKMKWDMNDSQVCQDRDGEAGSVRQQGVGGIGGASETKGDDEDSEESICSSESVSSVSGGDEPVRVFPADLRKIADLLPATSYATSEVARVHEKLAKIYAVAQMAMPDHPVEMFYPSITTEEEGIEAAFHHIYQTALEYLRVKGKTGLENATTVDDLWRQIQQIEPLAREKDGVYHALQIVYIAKSCMTLSKDKAVARMLGVLNSEKQRGDRRHFRGGHSRLTKVMERDVVVKKAVKYFESVDVVSRATPSLPSVVGASTGAGAPAGMSSTREGDRGNLSFEEKKYGEGMPFVSPDGSVDSEVSGEERFFIPSPMPEGEDVSLFSVPSPTPDRRGSSGSRLRASSDERDARENSGGTDPGIKYLVEEFKRLAEKGQQGAEADHPGPGPDRALGRPVR